MRWKVSFLAFIFTFLFSFQAYAAPTQYVYDYAGLLTNSEKSNLEKLTADLSAERGIAFIILTTNSTDGKTTEKYMGDFIDNNAVGYESDSGSTAIITLDMQNREVYVAGFGKAKPYLDQARVETILDEVTPAISEGNYAQAFELFIKQMHYYTGFDPGFNPDNLLFKFWFQLLVSVGVAAIVVGIMVANRGGRVTVDNSTYIDSDNSGVTNARDTYITTRITKVKKPSNNNKGGGLGGGMTGGGRSFSGGGRKF